MSTPNPSPDEHAAVRIVGTPTEPADNPALRKIARAILSIAARHLAREDRQQAAEGTHD